MEKSVPFEILGKKYSLAYTAKVTRQLDEHFCGIEHMPDKLADGTVGDQLLEVLTILAMLLRGGYEHDKAIAQISGEKFDLPEPPNEEMLESLYVIDDLSEVKDSIFSAIRSGSTPDIALKTESKNAGATPGE